MIVTEAMAGLFLSHCSEYMADATLSAVVVA
jgi:hypothetical protein